jgi:hypothetical protein
MDPSHGRLVFNHQEYGAVEGPDFELQPGRLRRMEVRLGSLCPPEWHPWYATLPRGAVRLRTHVSVRLDGVEVLATDADCFPASPGQLWIGERGGERSGEESFNGRIMARKSLEPDRAWVRGLTEQRGPLRLRVRFPRDRYGVSEPLLLTGVQGRADAVFVTYLREGLARFSFQHEGQALIVSGPLTVDYLQPHEILIDLGSLAPAVSSSRQVSGVRVEMDGRAVLESESATHPAEAWQAYVGATPWPMNTGRALFGGTILEATRTGDAQAALDAAVARRRPVELELWLPRHRTGEREPLLVSGKSGAGDSVYLQYVDEGHVIFGFDHWGSAPVISPPVAVDYAVAQRVTLALGALTGGEPGRLQVSLNDLPVIDTSAQFYPATAATLGRNAISASTSGLAFTGTILGVSAR